MTTEQDAAITRVLTHEEWAAKYAKTRSPGARSGKEVRCRDCAWSWAVPRQHNRDDYDRQRFYAEEHARETGHTIEPA